jgi:hypothetical protein
VISLCCIDGTVKTGLSSYLGGRGLRAVRSQFFGAVVLETSIHNFSFPKDWLPDGSLLLQVVTVLGMDTSWI